MSLLKVVGLIVALSMVLPVWSASTGSSSKTSTSSLVKSDSSSLKTFFINLWGKLKSVSPKHGQQASGHAIVTTAGIRGAESVDTLLSPYWKDDLSEDPEYKSEVELFTRGTDLASSGDIENAIVAFEGFVDNYPTSDLAPNAKFALGVAYSEFGEQDQAARILNDFVEKYQSHVLFADAKQLLNIIN